MTGPKTAAEAVANGAQLLDAKVPGWWRKIDLDSIQMDECQHCICGQLALATYDEVKRAECLAKDGLFYNEHAVYYGLFLEEMLGLEEDWRHGFSVAWDENESKALYEWEDLEAEWKRVINARLQADKLDALSQAEIDEVAELTGVYL